MNGTALATGKTGSIGAVPRLPNEGAKVVVSDLQQCGNVLPADPVQDVAMIPLHAGHLVFIPTDTEQSDRMRRGEELRPASALPQQAVLAGDLAKVALGVTAALRRMFMVGGQDITESRRCTELLGERIGESVRSPKHLTNTSPEHLREDRASGRQ